MLTLYHHGSSVCAAKVRLALAEKSLEWQSVYIDILKGEQFTPEYQRLNSKAVVPTLVHDAQTIVESTVINEYLDECFPDNPLKPGTAAARAEMRLWTKVIDEHLHPMCGEITFAASHRLTLARLSPDALDKFLNSTPPISVTATWHERKKQIVRQGFGAPGIDRAFKLYDAYLERMDHVLEDRAWLAGDEFSLADIAFAPYVNRLDMLSMSRLWVDTRPCLSDWFARVKARPSFQPQLLDWCPPDLTDDLRKFGAQSWPEVKRILGR